MTNVPETVNRRRRRRRRPRQRRAVTAVIVLLLIAVALATSYSAMRSQTVTMNVRQNAMLGVSARRAALTGLTAGLREMHSPDWSGTETTFSKALGTNESFQVQFLAGDDGLTAADSDFDDLPYRVTLLVTGTASDPADANRASQHTIRAVTRLILRAMPDEPSDWSNMQDYVFYQTEERDTTLDIPCRIEGKLRLQGRLRLGHHYPDDLGPWGNYFYHLNQMRWNGYADHRTVTGRVDFDYDAQDLYVRDLLVNYMSVSTSHLEKDTANADWSKPTSLTSYRLFPGGPEYEIPTLFGTLENTTLETSTTDNPLGLYYASSNLTLSHNVTVRGTLFCQDELRIEGANVRLESASIPPLHGSSLPIRLPVATCRNFEVRPSASCSVDGLLAAFGHVEVDSSNSRGTLEIRGRVIAKDLDIFQDTDWDAVDWTAQFTDYLDSIASSWVYFPVWMQAMGYPFAPTVHIKGGDDAQYHWYQPDATVFVPHADDFSEMDGDETPGLRWELIEIAHKTD